MTITEMMEMMMTNEKQLNKTNYNVNHSEFQKSRQTDIHKGFQNSARVIIYLIY